MKNTTDDIHLETGVVGGVLHAMNAFLSFLGVKFTLEQAMKAQRGSRGIALLII
jgi:hypothetical protein